MAEASSGRGLAADGVPPRMGLLFSSYQLRSMRLRNRIIASPLEKNLSDLIDLVGHHWLSQRHAID